MFHSSASTTDVATHIRNVTELLETGKFDHGHCNAVCGYFVIVPRDDVRKMENPLTDADVSAWTGAPLSNLPPVSAAVVHIFEYVPKFKNEDGSDEDESDEDGSDANEPSTKTSRTPFRLYHIEQHMFFIHNSPNDISVINTRYCNRFMITDITDDRYKFPETCYSTFRSHEFTDERIISEYTTKSSAALLAQLNRNH